MRAEYWAKLGKLDLQSSVLQMDHSVLILFASERALGPPPRIIPGFPARIEVIRHHEAQFTY